MTGNRKVGGLIGSSYGDIAGSYSSGNVTGDSEVGGLIGFTYGNINNSYSSANVTGTQEVGGLVGGTFGDSISNTYATGGVTGTFDVGGLVGTLCPDGCTAAISNSFWDTQSTGQINGIGDIGSTPGLTGVTTAEMIQMATFSDAGWSISDTGGSNAVWRIYEGFTAPLLRSFLAPLTATAVADNKTYDGSAYSGGNGVTYTGLINGIPTQGTLNYAGTSQGAINVGTYIISPTGLYSDQQGYDISIVNATLSITPAILRATGSQVYDGTTLFQAGNLLVNGVNGETFTASGSGTLRTKNVQTNQQLASVAGLTLTPVSGDLLSNYQSLSTDNTSVSVIPASLSLNAVPDSRVYDGTTDSSRSVVISPKLFGNDNVSNLTQSFVSKNVLGINGSTLQVNSGFSINDGNGGQNYTVTTNTASGTITPATLTATGSQVYNGTLSFLGSNLNINGVNGETFTASGSGTLRRKDVQTNQQLASVAGLALTPVSGDSLNNYQPLSTANTSVSVTPASLIATGSQIYNGTVSFLGSNLNISGVNGETFTASGSGTLRIKDVQTNQQLASVAGLTLIPVSGDHEQLSTAEHRQYFCLGDTSQPTYRHRQSSL